MLQLLFQGLEPKRNKDCFNTIQVLFFVFPTLDYLAVTSLYVHHQYIGGLTTLGALVHLTLHLLNESSSFKHLIFDNLMPTKRIVVSILSWITLFLGFYVSS